MTNRPDPLTGKEEKLVKKGEEKGDKVTFSMAAEVYSRKKASTVLERLKNKGWLENIRPGVFRIKPKDRPWKNEQKKLGELNG